MRKSKLEPSLTALVTKLHFEVHLTYTEIAERLGMTRNAVSGIVNRHRDRMKHPAKGQAA